MKTYIQRVYIILCVFSPWSCRDTAKHYVYILPRSMLGPLREEGVERGGVGDLIIAGLIFHKTERNNYRPENERSVKRRLEKQGCSIDRTDSHTLVNTLH